MIKNYHVFDDIISTEEQKILNDYVKSSNIEWVSMENVTGYYGGKLETHKFPAKVHPKSNCKNEEINHIIDNMQLVVAKNLNLEFIKNYRWKINWTTPIGDYNQMDLLHCDDGRNHIAMVYYINNSTGDTCIYNNINGNNAETYQKNFNGVDFNSYSLLTKVSPKMGRCVIFDGKLAHHGNYPSDGDRFILNFNFAAKSKSPQKSLI
jgi:hypothetical protein